MSPREVPPEVITEAAEAKIAVLHCVQARRRRFAGVVRRSGSMFAR